MKSERFHRILTGVLILSFFTVVTAVTPAAAQVPAGAVASDPAYGMVNPDEAGCTSIMVAKGASTDGSVITCHSCDGNYRTWLNIVPHTTHQAGSERDIYWGRLHTETAWDMRRMTLKGTIPQVGETWAYMNVGYPCMNEKGLAIGETTIGGRGDLRNRDGLFLIENLQAIVLERCTTAREAIRLIGELVAEYGYGDNGECLTFADAHEVWHFEIMGSTILEIGAVWAAVRIPDDHVGVSANIPRISTLDLDDPDHYMASDNVFSLAEEMGWYDPSSNEPFKWWKAYGRTDREGNPTPPYSTREFFILSTMAPSLGLTRDMEELPFSVKPDEKVSVRDVMRYYRETYEGTDLDASQNLTVAQRRYNRETGQFEVGEKVTSPLACNWTVGRDLGQLVNELVPGTVESQRTIAIAGCSYSQVIQCRDWLPPEIGTVAWFSFDNPGQSPRIPIFAGTLRLPPSFEICCQHRFRTDAAGWWFRRANRLSMIVWGRTRGMIEEAVMAFEDRAFTELPAVEQIYLDMVRTDYDAAREYITQYTNDFAHAAMHKWWELGDELWAIYARGW